MNVSSIKKEDCCGCTACMHSCGKRAIVMKSDEQGFFYPCIDEGLCVECGLCYNVCQARKEGEKQGVLSTYAAKNRSDEERKQASSGGVSAAFCAEAIARGWTVYGVKYDENHHVITAKATTMEACAAFNGSKYVQTDLQRVFGEIAQDLKTRGVLFFGTSCHVAGLKAFLASKKINEDNLITVDLICHGVPSPKVFEDYVAFINKKKKVKKFSFRTKYLAWGFGSKNFGTAITYKNGKVEHSTLKTKIPLTLFFSNNCLRPYCYTCPYVGAEKPADITIADYWGIQHVHPDFYDELGVSAVMTHTEKGDCFYQACQEIISIDSSVENVEKKQGNMHAPSSKAKTYDEFWRDYQTKRFGYIAKKYAYYDFSHRVKSWIKRSLGK